eukprot:scaffold294129_cov33-Tisochrysis_lutea.AAC.1
MLRAHQLVPTACALAQAGGSRATASSSRSAARGTMTEPRAARVRAEAPTSPFNNRCPPSFTAAAASTSEYVIPLPMP